MTEKKIKKVWYAIYTKPRFEKKVLERLLDEGYEAYVPIIEEIRIWSDRKKKVKVPLIKSYAFVHTDKNSLFDVLKIEGTLRILRHLGKPAVIRDFEIENLKLICDAGANVQHIASIENIEIGDAVEVVAGTLMGLKGKYVKDQGKKKVFIEIESLSNRMLLEVPVNYLQKIK